MPIKATKSSVEDDGIDEGNKLDNVDDVKFKSTKLTRLTKPVDEVDESSG